MEDEASANQAYNVAVGDKPDLRQLHALLLGALLRGRTGMAARTGAP